MTKVRKKPKLRRFTPEEDAILLKMRAEGASTYAIADAVGRCHGTIHARLKRIQGQVSGKRTPSKNSKEAPKVRIELLRDKFNEGQEVTCLTEAVGIYKKGVIKKKYPYHAYVRVFNQKCGECFHYDEIF